MEKPTGACASARACACEQPLSQTPQRGQPVTYSRCIRARDDAGAPSADDQRRQQARFAELVKKGCSDRACYKDLSPTNWKPYCVISRESGSTTSVIKYVLERGTVQTLKMVLDLFWFTFDQIMAAVYRTKDPAKVEALLLDPAVPASLRMNPYYTHEWVLSLCAKEKDHNCDAMRVVVRHMPDLVAGTPDFDDKHFLLIGSMCSLCRKIVYPFTAKGATAADLEERFHPCMLSVRNFALKDDTWFIHRDTVYSRVFGMMLDFYKGKLTNYEIVTLMNKKTGSWRELLMERNMHLDGTDYMLETLKHCKISSAVINMMEFTMGDYLIEPDFIRLFDQRQLDCIAFYKSYPYRMHVDAEKITFEHVKKVPEIITTLPADRARPMLADLVEYSSYSLGNLHVWIINTFPWEMMLNYRLRRAVYERCPYNYGAAQLVTQYRKCVAITLLMCQRRGRNLLALLDRNAIQNIMKWI